VRAACQHGGVRETARSRVLERLVRLSGAGLDLATFIDEADALVGRVIPHEGACWHTLDPATMIQTGSWTLNLPSHGAEAAENEYLSDDFNRFADLARSARHSASLTEATGGDPLRSDRFRRLMRPGGIRGELRTTFVVDGAGWGSAAMFRAAPDDFTERESEAAHELAAPVARGIRAALVRDHRGRSGAPPAAPGLLLLDDRQRVESVTGPALQWLAELGHPAGEPLQQECLPYALFAVAARAGQDSDATVRVRGASGRWVTAHASVVTGGEGERVAVILQGATAPALAPLIAAAYGLTRRERAVSELVLQGQATADIAASLLISRHTVQEHLKSIFEKAGVRSRRELVGKVFMRHYRPFL